VLRFLLRRVALFCFLYAWLLFSLPPKYCHLLSFAVQMHKPSFSSVSSTFPIQCHTLDPLTQSLSCSLTCHHHCIPFFSLCFYFLFCAHRVKSVGGQNPADLPRLAKYPSPVLRLSFCVCFFVALLWTLHFCSCPLVFSHSALRCRTICTFVCPHVPYCSLCSFDVQ
jgi:hypothetical protein